MERKEAIEVIKRNWHDSSFTMLREALETIIPELKESEGGDEKIRKWLIDMVEEVREINPTNADHNGNCSNAIAWLEKQGEKTSDKIVEKARTEKQRVLLTETDGSANIDWDCRSLDDVKILLKCGLEFIRTIEANKQILTDNRFGGCSFRVPSRYDKGIKQGEQNSADNKGMNIDEESMTPFQKEVFCIIDTTIEEEQGLKQVCDKLLALASNEIKQKPAWSEEDEEMLNQVIEDIVKLAGPYVCYHKDVDWLKSLKDNKGVLYDLARNSIIQGYHQAEKDLELTWEDVRRIYLLVNSTINDVGMDNLTDKSIYQEVLKRFKDLKK